jgi:hypothetical protein
VRSRWLLRWFPTRVSTFTAPVARRACGGSAAFLRHVARSHPDGELQLVMDNYAAQKRVEIRTWLAANPTIQVHFTPTSGSWLNLVEVWFGIIERQAIHPGTFRSVPDLMIKIRQFIDGWNDRKHPFIWTKTADDILDRINRKRISTPDD